MTTNKIELSADFAEQTKALFGEERYSQFYSAHDQYNAPVWEGDACEAFICTDATRDWYYEVEIAPNNTVFLKHMHNKGCGIFDEFDIEENFVKSEVRIDGNDYKVKFLVPLDKIGYDKNVGIWINIFRIEFIKVL